MIDTSLYRTTQFYTKKRLYNNIDKLREGLGIHVEDYPIDINRILENLCDTIDITKCPFVTEGFCGLLFRNKNKSHIVVNEVLSQEEQTFAISHEVVHLFCHDKQTKFMCKPFDKKTNDSFEWQANEGAAELLLPYKIFIPSYIQTFEQCNNKENAIQILATTHKLSSKVIEYRLDNLQCEFEQYTSGKHLDELEILSQKKYLQLKAEDKLKIM